MNYEAGQEACSTHDQHFCFTKSIKKKEKARIKTFRTGNDALTGRLRTCEQKVKIDVFSKAFF